MSTIFKVTRRDFLRAAGVGTGAVVFGCYISPVGDLSAGRLASEKFFSDHPLFSVGVRTNANLQPVGERGQVLCENLWAAGSLIGGYNPATEHCGMGVAAGTGTLSGRMAAS